MSVHPPAHFFGLFLTDEAQREVWRAVKDLVGTSCEPPGTKRAGDHVTLLYEPEGDDLETCMALTRNARGMDDMRVRATHACAREKSLVLCVSMDLLPSLVPYPTSAYPHVSVFCPTEDAWSDLGRLAAEDYANGNALDLAAIGEDLDLEVRLGVKFRNGAIYFGEDDWDGGESKEESSGKRPVGLESPCEAELSVGREMASSRATSMGSEYAVRTAETPPMREQPGPSSSRRELNEEEKKNKILREYLQLCEMFEVHHPELVKTTFVKHGFDMEKTAQDLLTQMTLDTEGFCDEVDYYDDYEEEDYYEEDYENEFVTDDKKHAMQERKAVDISLNQCMLDDWKARNEARGREEARRKEARNNEQADAVKRALFAGGAALHSNLRPNYNNGTEVGLAARRWRTLQGPGAETVRARKYAKDSKVASWQHSRLRDLSEELARLTLRRDRGDREAAEKIQQKIILREAIKDLGRASDEPEPEVDTRYNRVLDFHGHDRMSAIAYLERELISCAPMVTSDWTMKLITGRGKHSMGGRVIHGEIMRRLRRYGIAFEEYTAHIIIRASASITGQ